MEPNEILLSEEPEALQEIAKFSTTVSVLLRRMTELDVTTDEECKSALKIAGEAKYLHKQIEEIRKKSIEPSRKIIAIINDSAKFLTTQLDDLGETVKVKLAIWQKKLEEDAKEAKERASELSKQLGIEIYVAGASKTLSNEYAVASSKTVWEFAIVDEKLIPREYLIVDEDKIKKAIKAGIREIPGLNIWEATSMTIRRR